MGVTSFESEVFPEKGVRIVQVVFKDEDGNVVVPNPNTIKWTLTDRPTKRGEVTSVINSRELVAIASASTVNIVLEGSDLALQSSESALEHVSRVLTVQYQYDSSLANNLDDKAEYIFQIRNMYYPT